MKRFDVFLVNLDQNPSDDPKNTRPCVIVSPDEMNRNIENVIIAPLSSTQKPYPTRVPLNFLNNDRSVVLDQLRTIDKVRLVKKIGEVDADARKQITARLLEMFAE